MDTTEHGPGSDLEKLEALIRNGKRKVPPAPPAPVDRFYPQDGGMVQQVRPFEETQSAFDVMRDHFFKDDDA